MSRVKLLQTRQHEAKVEFFYDTSSPWTYLAFSRIREVCRKHDAHLVLVPILVGGVFNMANKGLYAVRDRLMAQADNRTPIEQREKPSAKSLWGDKDLKLWADYTNLNISSLGERFNARTKTGAPGHPISAIKMLRGALIAEEESTDALIRFSLASFDAYWGKLLDVSDDDVILELHETADLTISQDVFLRRIKTDQNIKDKLRENTDELVRRGGFGSPSIFISRVNDKKKEFGRQMHFGNDRMELVEAAILKAQGRPYRFHEIFGFAPRKQPLKT